MNNDEIFISERIRNLLFKKNTPISSRIIDSYNKIFGNRE